MCFVPSASRIERLQRTLSAQLRVAKHAHGKGGKHSTSMLTLGAGGRKTTAGASAEANNDPSPFLSFPLGTNFQIQSDSLTICFGV